MGVRVIELAVDADLAGAAIDAQGAERGDLVDLGPARTGTGTGQHRLGATQDGADAGRHLAGRERLHHVVVGAELEPDDAVDLLDVGGEQDHRDGALR